MHFLLCFSICAPAQKNIKKKLSKCLEGTKKSRTFASLS